MGVYLGAVLFDPRLVLSQHFAILVQSMVRRDEGVGIELFIIIKGWNDRELCNFLVFLSLVDGFDWTKIN